MKTLNSKKGFTLIELLIVIAIIAVLAVAFLPTILGAPAKGRDTARIASLQKIQKVLVVGDLSGKTLPANNCVNGSPFSAFVADFGGSVPKDPQSDNKITTTISGTFNNCPGEYLYVADPNNGGTVKSGTYKFGLLANVEVSTNANTLCEEGSKGELKPIGAETNQEKWCYAVFTTK